MVNPAMLLKIKKSWDTFNGNHPKFQPFLMAALPQMREGTVLEMKVVNPEGEEITTNLKLKAEDIALFESLRGDM